MNRAAELGRLDALLAADAAERRSLCVIAGTAGSGKTSLALHWAHRVRDQFPDGQLHVNLRGYDPGEPVTAQQALRHFLTSLGVPSDAIPADPDSGAARYRSLLAERRMLVLLDNAASTAQVRPLLPGAPGCLTIVTSRSHLPGLAVRDGAERLLLGTLTEAEATALLRAVTDAHRTDAEEALAELAALCAQLPLALRIAAERAAQHPHMPLDELIADLRDESALWDALSIDDEGEAEAVRSVFAWSYRALPSAAARLFRLLGLHPGPDFGVGAAAALAAVPARQARRLLDVLVGATMLEQTAPGRYEFHDLLRAFAANRAKAEEPPEERTAALRRVLGWYLHSADAAQSWIRPDEDHLPGLEPPGEGVEPLAFADRDAALDWAEREQPKFLPAVRAAEQAGLDTHAWQLALVAWNAQPPSVAVTSWLPTGQIALTAARRVDDRAGQALVLEALGFDHAQAHQLEQAREHHEAALALRRELGDRYGEATSLNALGLVHWRMRELDRAEVHLGQAIAAFADLGETHWEAVSRTNLAEVHHLAGRLDDALEGITAALAAHRAFGDEHTTGDSLDTLSAIRLDRGEPELALQAAEEAVDIAIELRHHLAEGHWLLSLGDAQRALGRPGEALVSYQRSAVLHRRLGDRSREARAWQGAGLTYQQLGRADEAAAFHRRAAAAHRDLGEGWYEAMALEALGAALREDEPDQARRHWTAALHCIQGYTDPRAEQARRRISDLLAGEASG